MELFDSILDRVKGAATDVFGDDTDEMFDSAGSLFAGRGEGSGDDDGDGDSGWGSALSSFLGGGDEGSDGSDDGDDGGGWSSALGDMVDRLSGDGGRDQLLDGLLDRAGSYLPEDLRGTVGSLFGGEGSSWAGSLVDPSSTEMPDGWQSIAGAALGQGFGEDGVEGLLQHSLSRLTGTGVRAAQSGMAPDPRLTTRPGDLGRPGDRDGDGIPDVYDRPNIARPGDHDGDGIPDAYDRDAVGRPAAYDRDGDGYDDRDAYDDLVTRGADGNPDDDYRAPADPTFPADPDPEPAPVAVAVAVAVDEPAPAPPPMEDFRQSIDSADQVDESMDTMFEGLE